jgi:hypothetical protein
MAGLLTRVDFLTGASCCATISAFFSSAIALLGFASFARLTEAFFWAVGSFSTTFSVFILLLYAHADTEIARQLFCQDTKYARDIHFVRGKAGHHFPAQNGAQ